MLRIIHLCVGTLAVIISVVTLIMGLKAPAVQPEAGYLLLLGLINLIFIPYRLTHITTLQYAASLLMIIATALQAAILFFQPEIPWQNQLWVFGILPTLAVALHFYLISRQQKRPAQALATATNHPIDNPMDNNRERGVVRWFNTSKGFGFITCDNGNDVFVHFRAIRGEGHRVLLEGQQVEFSTVNRDKGIQAEDVVIL